MIHADDYPDPRVWEGYQLSRSQSQGEGQCQPWTDEERVAVWADLLEAARAHPGLIVEDDGATVEIFDRDNPWDGGVYRKQHQRAYEEARGWLREHSIVP